MLFSKQTENLKIERDMADQLQHSADLGGHSRVSHQQKDDTINFMLGHPGLATNKIIGPQAAATKQRLWTELTEILNACPSGATKSPEKWAKVWQDLRGYCKKKAGRLKVYQSGTGAGGPPKSDLTTQEEKVIGILGKDAVEGFAEVPDSLQHLRRLRDIITEPSLESTPFHDPTTFLDPGTSLGADFMLKLVHSTASTLTCNLPIEILSSPLVATSSQLSQTSSCTPSSSKSPSTSHSSSVRASPVVEDPPPPQKPSKRKRLSAPCKEDPYEERVTRAAQEQAAALKKIADCYQENSVIYRDTLKEFAEFLRRH